MLTMALTTLPLYNAIEGWIFFIFGCTCTLGLVYIAIFMKETKGVSKVDQKRLYHKGGEGEYGALTSDERVKSDS